MSAVGPGPIPYRESNRTEDVNFNDNFDVTKEHGLDSDDDDHLGERRDDHVQKDKVKSSKKKKFKPWKSFRNVVRIKNTKKRSKSQSELDVKQENGDVNGEHTYEEPGKGDMISDKEVRHTQSVVISDEDGFFADKENHITNGMTGRLQNASSDDGLPVSPESASSDHATDRWARDSGIISADDERSFSHGDRHTPKESPSLSLNAETSFDASEDFGVISGISLLDADAAKHKISIKPKTRKPSSRRSRSPQISASEDITSLDTSLKAFLSENKGDDEIDTPVEVPLTNDTPCKENLSGTLDQLIEGSKEPMKEHDSDDQSDQIEESQIEKCKISNASKTEGDSQYLFAGLSEDVGSNDIAEKRVEEEVGSKDVVEEENAPVRTDEDVGTDEVGDIGTDQIEEVHKSQETEHQTTDDDSGEIPELQPTDQPETTDVLQLTDEPEVTDEPQETNHENTDDKSEMPEEELEEKEEGDGGLKKEEQMDKEVDEEVLTEEKRVTDKMVDAAEEKGDLKEEVHQSSVVQSETKDEEVKDAAETKREEAILTESQVRRDTQERRTSRSDRLREIDVIWQTRIDDDDEREEDKKPISVKDRISRFQNVTQQKEKSIPPVRSTSRSRLSSVDSNPPLLPTSKVARVIQETVTPTVERRVSDDKEVEEEELKHSSCNSNKKTTGPILYNSTPSRSIERQISEPGRISTPVPKLCISCRKRVYVNEMVKAEGSIFHKSCQRCSHCQKTLRIGNLMVIERTLYCKLHGSEVKDGLYSERLLV